MAHQPSQDPSSPLLSTRQETSLITLALLMMIVIGLWLGGDYGISIDEPHAVIRGKETLEIYQGQRNVRDTTVSLLREGPFFPMVAYVAGGWVAGIRTGWIGADGRHFIFYLTFVVATVFMGLLAGRYTSRRAAWIVAAAFFTQPLLFGHAFINPKDLAFTACLLAALVMGLMALPQGRSPAYAASPQDISQARTNAGEPGRPRWQGFALSALALAAIAGLVLWQGLESGAQSWLGVVYRGQAPSWIVAVFHRFAQNAASAPLVAYQAKLSVWLNWFRWGLAAGLTFGLLLAWGLALSRPAAAVPLGRRELGMAAASGLALGLATSIRAIAPLVALPLIYLFAVRYRWRALAHILVLGAVSGAVCLASWPYLWSDPVGHFVQAANVLAQFPWTGDIVFNGALLDAGSQPWYYVPEIFALQLTLPVLGLALIGVVAAVSKKRPTLDRWELGAIILTLAIPWAASLRPGTIIYNNARQLFFTLPAVFLLAGLGIQSLMPHLRRPAWRWGFVGIVLLPGIVGIARLHPYEYIYYNALAGTTPSVYQRFESDYWCTSYREAMHWVNANAPPNAIIAVGSAGFTEQVSPFARSDLKVVRLGSTIGTAQATFAITCDGHSGRQDLLPDSPVLMTVSRAGADLAEVKDLRTTR